MTKKNYWLSSLLILVALSTSAGGPPNIDKALQEQRALIAERPYDAQLHNDLGNLLTLVEDWDGAAAAYGQAITIDPDDPSALFNLALLEEQQGRLDDAVRSLQKVVELSPYHGRAYYQLGTIFHSRGDRSKALESYAQAFAADPTLTFASVNPHIIENDLRMEAMLMSSRFEAAAETQQPRVYGEPERIRDLMIRNDREERMEDASAEMYDDRQAAPAREALEDDDDDTGSGLDARFDDEDGEREPPAATRVLSRETLESSGGSTSRNRSRRRPSGVGAGSSYRPPSRADEGGAAVGRDSGNNRGRAGSVTRVGRGRASEGSVSEDSGDSDGAAVRPSTRPRRVGRGYRAGVASTGSLKLDLLPRSAPQAAATTEVVAAKR